MPVARYPGIDKDQVRINFIIKGLKTNLTLALVITFWLLDMPKSIEDIKTIIKSPELNMIHTAKLKQLLPHLYTFATTSNNEP